MKSKSHWTPSYLFVNKAKTDSIHIFPANTSETDTAGNMLRGNKKWWYHWTMLVYNAMVIPVMLYNCSSWAVTTTLIHKLDICHRSHLQSILGMHWPNGIISNEDLYICCGTGLLSQQVRRMRRSMFSHVLRMPKDTPVQLSLQFVVAGSNRYRGRIGRQPPTYLTCSAQTLKRRASSYARAKTLLDLEKW